MYTKKARYRIEDPNLSEDLNLSDDPNLSEDLHSGICFEDLHSGTCSDLTIS